MTQDFVISIPKRLTLISGIYDLKLPQKEIPSKRKCVLDFSECEFGEPLPLLLLGLHFHELKRRNPDVEFVCRSRNSDFRGYADHIGFFKYLGFNRGNPTNHAAGSRNYTPITLFNIKQLRSDAAEGPVGELVDKEASKLAEIVTQKNDGALFDVIQYSFREILRNAVEHSQGSVAVVFGQYWPYHRKAEIVIYDNGVGIFETLLDNEYVEFSSNSEALKSALLPGISGVGREERAQQDDRWGNSGFGLFVTSRLCSEAGLFRMISGNSTISLKCGVQTETNWSFDGTCVQLIIDTGSIGSKVDRIREIVEEGEDSRKELMDDFPIKASVASKFLSRDFEKVAV